MTLHRQRSRRASLQRANLIRALAARPASTSLELARVLHLRSQNVGQMLHKAEQRGEVRSTFEPTNGCTYWSLA